MVSNLSRAVPERLLRDLRFAALQCVPLWFLTALLLDGGNLFRWTGIALLGYLLGVVAVAKKRLAYASATDRFFVRWGSLPLIVLAWVIEPAVHHYIHW